MKKLLCLILSAILLVAFMAACASPTDGGGGGTDGGGGGGTIVLRLGIYPPATEDDRVAMHERFLASFAVMRPDVTVEKAHYEYSTDTFIPMAQAGNTPTIFETWFTEPQKLINSGYVRDITDILKARGWYDMMVPYVRDLLSKDGKVYGVPRDAYVLGLHLNLELFEDAGLMDGNMPQYPKTWAELATTGKAIKDATGMAGLVLLAHDNAGGWHFSNIAWAFGADLVIDNGDGTYTSNLNSAAAIAAMEYVSGLRWEYDILTADPTAEHWGTGFQHIGVGTAAMYIGANDAVNQPTANNGLPVDKLALVPMPAGPGGQFSLSGGTPYMFCVNATDDEVNAALDYLIVMGLSPEVTEDAIQGLRDDAEVRKAEGVPVLMPFSSWDNPPLTAARQAVVNEFANVDMALFNDYFNNSRIRPEEPGDVQEMYRELTNVLQAVVTDRNADITALLNTANSNYQEILVSQGIGR